MDCVGDERIRYPIGLELVFSGLRASALFYKDGRVVLLKGPQISKYEKEYLKDIYKDDRKELKEQGLVYDKGDYYVLTEDRKFNNLSRPACVVTGKSSNGWDEWKVNGSNKSIKDYLENK